jgi:hypothetical protein
MKTRITIKSVSKHLLCVAMVVFTFARVSAQDEETYLDHHAKVDMTVTGFGISYELPVSPKTLLKAEAGFGGGYEISFNGYRYLWNILNPSEYFNLHLKYYYNRDIRYDKGKTLQYNSGNYLGVHTKYVTSSLWKNDKYTGQVLLLGFHYGLQRRLFQNLALEFYLGPGVGYNLSKTVTPYLDTNLKISYIFF